jgi:hypothetical protein
VEAVAPGPDVLAAAGDEVGARLAVELGRAREVRRADVALRLEHAHGRRLGCRRKRGGGAGEDQGSH